MPVISIIYIFMIRRKKCRGAGAAGAPSGAGRRAGGCVGHGRGAGRDLKTGGHGRLVDPWGTWTGPSLCLAPEPR